MLLAVSNVEPEDPEMLLTPSLISQSSTISNASLALSIFSSPKRRSPTNVPADCSADSSSMKDLAAASAIGEATLNIIVSGYIGQSGENLDKLKVESALGSPLSSLVPTMFNPGFQKVGYQTADFLFLIIHPVHGFQFRISFNCFQRGINHLDTHCSVAESATKVGTIGE